MNKHNQSEILVVGSVVMVNTSLSELPTLWDSLMNKWELSLGFFGAGEDWV